jgi:hypothetical protein
LPGKIVLELDPRTPQVRGDAVRRRGEVEEYQTERVDALMRRYSRLELMGGRPVRYSSVA